MPIKVVAKDSPEYAEIQQMRAKREEQAKKEAGKKARMRRCLIRKNHQLHPNLKRKPLRTSKRSMVTTAKKTQRIL